MKKLSLFILIALSLNAGAQSLSPKVVSSSGEFYSNASAQLSFTVGELAAVTTLSSASNFLTQGFQQTYDFSTAVPVIEEKDFSVSVFPNPSQGIFFIKINSPEIISIAFSVYDMLGRKIISSEKFSGMDLIIPLDLSHSITGMYLLECTVINSSSGKKNIFNSKLNLIY